MSGYRYNGKNLTPAPAPAPMKPEKPAPRGAVALDELADLIDAGLTTPELAAHFGVCRQTVNRTRARAGLKAPQFIPTDRERLVELVAAGYSNARVAHELGVHKTTVARTKRILGLTRTAVAV